MTGSNKLPLVFYTLRSLLWSEERVQRTAIVRDILGWFVLVGTYCCNLPSFGKLRSEHLHISPNVGDIHEETKQESGAHFVKDKSPAHFKHRYISAVTFHLPSHIWWERNNKLETFI